MSTTARIETIQRLFLTFVALMLVSLFGIAVTGNAWFWASLFAGFCLAFRQGMKMPSDYPLRIYLRGRADAWC